MKKISILLLCLGCFLVANGALAASLPISNLPNWSTQTSSGPSSFAVFLDSRYANNENTTTPEGGVKFELWLANVVTDNVDITKVQYVNTTKGETHVIAPYVYDMPDGTKFTEYSMWLGNAGNLVGNWTLTIATSDKGTFVYKFAVTDPMLKFTTKPPKPTVTVAKKLTNGSLTGYTITAKSSSLPGMKARLVILEDAGNNIIYRSDYVYPASDTAVFTISNCIASSTGKDCDLSNNPTRIEVKNNNMQNVPWFRYSATTRNAEPARTIKYFVIPK
ncbi:MAG: hypothetical protein ACLGPL_02775 [Acidobacteriota bacterium]